jgi:hypothetical protein
MNAEAKLAAELATALIAGGKFRIVEDAVNHAYLIIDTAQKVFCNKIESARCEKAFLSVPEGPAPSPSQISVTSRMPDPPYPTPSRKVF